MKKKEKKQLTPVQKKRRYRAGQWSCYFAEFLSVIAPYITIGAINFNEYFVQTGADSWKVSLGGILAMGIMGIAITTLGHEKTKDNRTLKIVVLGFGWLTASLILFMLSAILGDVSMIMFCGSLGIFAAAGFDIGSGKLKKKADRFKQAIEDNEIKDSLIASDVERSLKYQQMIEDRKQRAVD